MPMLFERLLLVLSKHGVPEAKQEEARQSYYKEFPSYSLQVHICQEVDLILQILKHNPLLALLDLTSCEIGDYECTMLAEGLKHSTELEELVLSNNQIGDDGIVASSRKRIRVHF